MDGAVSWARAYFAESCPEGPAVVGISGGKDSSIVAALCARALGAGRVFGLLMPQGEQWDIDVARDLVAHLGIRSAELNIGESAEALFSALRQAGLGPCAQALVNTPARLRMAALYAAAAALGGRVANTCNLSEAWVGYSTKFGDTAGDFSLLSGFTATEAKAVGRELGLPERFVCKAPEDGLSGMTDEESLGFSYGALDRYIRGGGCGDERVREKIDGLRRLGMHKLEPMPRYSWG